MSAVPDASVRPDRRAGYAAAALVVAIWVTFSLMGRWAGQGAVPGAVQGAIQGAAGGGARLTPWDLGGLRFGIAWVAAVGLWCAGYGRGLPWRRGLALGALGGAGFALPSFVGFSMAPVAHGAMILSGTLPFLVAIGTWLVFHEPWSRARRMSLVLLLAGFVLVGTEAYWRQAAPPGAWRGDLLFLAASSSWAAYTVLVRRWGPDAMQSIVAVGLWCGSVFVPLWWWALPSRVAVASTREIVAQAAFQGIVATLLSLWVYTRALRALGAARLTTFTALVPGLAALLAVPLLGEPLGVLSLAGLAMVVGAVMVGVGR